MANPTQYTIDNPPFPNGTLNEDDLHTEMAADATVGPVFVSVMSDGTTCFVRLTGEPSGPEQTAMDDVIDAHQGDAMPPPKDLGSVITYWGATPTTSNPTTTNTAAPGDVCPELTTSFVKKRDDSTLRCFWGMRHSNSANSGKTHTTLVVDGTEYADHRMRTGFESSSSNDQGQASARVDVKDKDAGTYTVAVYFWVTTSTGKLEGTDRYFYIEEVVMP